MRMSDQDLKFEADMTSECHIAALAVDFSTVVTVPARKATVLLRILRVLLSISVSSLLLSIWLVIFITKEILTMYYS